MQNQDLLPPLLASDIQSCGYEIFVRILFRIVSQILFRVLVQIRIQLNIKAMGKEIKKNMN